MLVPGDNGPCADGGDERRQSDAALRADEPGEACHNDGPEHEKADGGPERTRRTPGRVGPTAPPVPGHRPTHHRDQGELDERLDDPVERADGERERNGPEPKSNRPPGRGTRVNDPRGVLAALDLVKLLLQVIARTIGFHSGNLSAGFPESQVMDAREAQRLCRCVPGDRTCSRDPHACQPASQSPRAGRRSPLSGPPSGCRASPGSTSMSLACIDYPQWLHRGSTWLISPQAWWRWSRARRRPVGA